MKISDIKSACADYSLAANKKLGQNFLCDENILRNIVEVCELNNVDEVLEIGPGLGSLTEYLLAHSKKVTAVEIDKGLYAYLSKKFAEENLTLIHADFLKNQKIFPGISKIVANLPYYCASEMLFRFSENYPGVPVWVMIQKEMAERLAAKPGTKSYGAMTVMLEYHYQSTIEFNVQPGCFYPQPDIVSSFVSLKPRQHDLDDVTYLMFKKIVSAAFWGRRKTLGKCLSTSPFLKIPKEILAIISEKKEIDLKRRGEELSLAEFISLAKLIIAEGFTFE